MVLEEAEDVFLWFSNLSTSKRINVMYGLLNKCLPFEWRFLGSCIEDLFKQYFSYFRDTEFRANSPPDLSKLSDLSESSVRYRLILSVAFLYSSNRTCSNIIFSALTSEPNVEILSHANTKGAIEEYLLLFTLACRHPAFTFEQKQTLEWRLKELSIAAELLEADEQIKSEAQPGQASAKQQDEAQVTCEDGIHYANGVLTSQCTTCGAINVAQYIYPSVPYNWPCVPPSTSPPLAPQPPPIIPPPASSVVSPVVSQVTRSQCTTRPTVLPLPTPRAHVKHLELKNAPRKKKLDKRTDFRIQVTWSNGESTEVSKTLQDLCDFHQQLTKTVRTPYFAGPPKQSLRGDESAEDGTGRINEYLRQLTGKVPLDSELVVGFFRSSAESSVTAHTNNASTTTALDDRIACSSPTAALPHHSNPMSPPPTVHSKYTVASSVHTIHCAAVGVNDVSHQLGSLTIYNSCHSNESSTKGPVIASFNQQPCARVAPSTEAQTVNVCTKHLAGTGAKQGSQNQNECNDDLARLERVFESEKLSKLWEMLRRKHLPTKQILNLTEDDLKNDGFSSDKAEKILKLFRAYKQKLPNGFYSHADIDQIPKSQQISQHYSTLPAGQPSCCMVQTVQTQVYMPDAPIDLLASHCIDPMASHSINNRHSSSRNSPDTSRSCPASSTKAICNGESDEIFAGEHRDSADGYARLKNKNAADLSVKENDLPRDYRPRKNSRGGGIHPKMKSTNGGSRKSSLTSVDVRPSQSPGCEDSSDAKSGQSSGGEARPHPHSHSNIPYVARNGSSPLGISEDTAPPSSALLANNPSAAGNLPGIPSYSTAPSGVYPTSTPQQLHSHMPRLPSRPLAAMNMCTSCPCSRPSATPPPLPSPHPMTYPQIMPFFPAFPPNHLATQATYLSPHATNGFVTTPPGVPPPRTFQFLHSPEGITAHEVTFPHQFNNMLQVQQPPPASQRMQPPPPVPGFVAGPSPNVGFHGNPMHPTSLTSLPQPPGAGGMAPPQVSYIAKPTTCFNCGHAGHQGSECMEKTMDDISKGGQFQLSFNRGDKGSSDGCE